MTVPPTQAGEQLHQRLAPLFDDIDNEINALSELRDTLRGRLRINGTEHVLELLWPKFMRFMQAYPEVELELVGEMRFVDIVAERFDAGIRLGDDVERDMIAVRVTPDMQMCVVASPVYPGLKRLPQTQAGLMEHPCVNRSLPAGGVLAWEFRDPSDGRLVKVRPRDVLPAAAVCCCRRRWPAWGCSGFRARWWPTGWPVASWSRCWRTGPSATPAITSITRTVGRIHVCSRRW